MEKLKPFLIYILIAFVAVVVGFYAWKDWQSASTGPGSQINQEEEDNATSTQDGVVIEKIPLGNDIPMPNLDKAVAVSPKTEESLKANFLDKIKAISAELKQDPTDLSKWIELGIYKKTLGDYKGAEEIWIYVSKVNPKGIVAYNNLGDLYTYYIRDNNLAEKNFLKAISLEPDKVFLYNSLYELYRFNFKDDVKAKAILEEGIKANPADSSSLKYLLDNF